MEHCRAKSCAVLQARNNSKYGICLYSLAGYTAIVKLLKKHHKRTGLLVQAPHLRQLLAEPSWSTEVGEEGWLCRG